MIKDNLKKITYLNSTTFENFIKSFGKYSHLTNNKPFCIVVNRKGKCLGTITDGDVRRYLSLGLKTTSDTIERIAKKRFIFLKKTRSLNQTFRKFEGLFSVSKGIFSLPVLSKNGKLIDIVNYNDIISDNYIKKIISNKKNEQIVDIRNKKINDRKNRILISVPTRLSFVGGGYDFTDYISKFDNFILSVALDYRVYIKLKIRNDNNVFIDIVNSSKKKNYSIKNINKENDLVSCVLKSIKFNRGIEITIYSDFCIGSGLGGSSSVAVGIIAGIKKIFSKNINVYEIANLAYNAERIVFGNKGGWQDFFTSCYGGFNWLKMLSSDIEVEHLKIKKEYIEKLNSEIIFFKYGQTRDSGKIQSHLLKNFNKELINNRIQKISLTMKKCLLNGNFSLFYKSLNKAWFDKVKKNPKSTNSRIINIYNEAIKKGAYAGKLLGAGRSGYFVFFAPLEKKTQLINYMKKYSMRPEKINFSEEGIKFSDYY
jgi:D-glycero-alpha-D-manno-heptose-7-phosphate kinase